MKNKVESKFRIFISNDKWKHFVLFELQEFKKKYFWSGKSWVTLTGGATHYTDTLIQFCIDEWLKSYPNAEVINTSSLFVGKEKEQDEVDKLLDLHIGFRFFLTGKNFEFVNQMMSQFGQQSNNNELKTVLVITKSFKEHEVLKENRQRIKNILESRIGKLV